MKLTVGSEGSEYVTATFGDRPYADSNEAFDRNMVAVRIDVAVRPFSGSYDAVWRTETVPRFGAQLQRLYATLEGVAEFAPDYEQSLVLRFAGDGLGHISVSGEACPDPAGGPWLRFDLPSIDQTYLPAIIDALAELLRRIPSCSPDCRVQAHGHVAPYRRERAHNQAVVGHFASASASFSDPSSSRASNKSLGTLWPAAW